MNDREQSWQAQPVVRGHAFQNAREKATLERIVVGDGFVVLAVTLRGDTDEIYFSRIVGPVGWRGVGGILRRSVGAQILQPGWPHHIGDAPFLTS